MSLARHLRPALVASLLLAVQVGAQQQTGTITGRVVDTQSQQPLSNATVNIPDTQWGTQTREDGRFFLTGVPAGVHRLRASRIGFASQEMDVSVTAGGTATMQFALQPVATVLGEMVVVGYGTQRREAITGSVATIDADEANVGVVTNANDMITGRVPGVQVTLNSGEPGASAQIRIRGGTSISASNEPLYVIDGVPINNVGSEPGGIGIGGSAALARSPLNMLNPSDIESITVLKDASATAIYGSRGANGVILIQTKQGTGGQGRVEYDSYVATSSPARYLDVLDGAGYRRFVQDQIDDGELNPDRLASLGTANTDWERAVTRRAVSHNHNLAFSGGTPETRYRASLNYMNQQGVLLSNGLERYQGRLNGTHHAFSDRLRLGLNLTASHVANDYLAFENTGGFEGGVLANVVMFNPTRPVYVTDEGTGQQVYYEVGTGRQSVRNPVALAEQIQDFGNTTRILGNVSAALDLLPGLIGSVNVGVDRSDGIRRIYFPMASPVGAEWGGLASQVSRDQQSLTFQGLLTFSPTLAAGHDFEIVGGYEYNDFLLGEFGAQGRGFLSDALGFYGLGAGSEDVPPFSWREQSRLVSFFTRAHYSLNDRYFLTGVLRQDGSSRFGTGNKWALFPAISASWRISEEEFARGLPFSDLRIRAGWGLQGNPAVPPYASLTLLSAGSGFRYPFGQTVWVGVAPYTNSNPNLRWEETEQINFALDYGLRNNQFTGSIEYYIKNTTDLLLEVRVPTPAPASHRFENIGATRNQGLELSFDANVIERPGLTWSSGLVFAAERNEVTDLGGRNFITTGGVSGQGMSGQVSQRIMPGYALGTFYGPEFVGINDEGQQLFNQYTVERDETGRETSRTLIGQTTDPTGDDFVVIGDANPDFTLGLRSQIGWNKFDLSFLIRSEVGRDVFNNTAVVYAAKSNVLTDRNILVSALNDPTGLREPAIYSSRWIEDASFVRLQNLTLGYTFDLPGFTGAGRGTRVYVSGDNLILLTDYSGLDPETHTESGVASRGIDYLSYPRPRTFTAGVRVQF